MSLSSRLDRIEKRMEDKNKMIVATIPYELIHDEVAKERHIREHYPEAIDFQGLVVEVMQFSEKLGV